MPFSGELLKQARNEACVTLQQLADAVGVDRMTILNYQSGRSVPTADRLKLLASALEVPMDFFFAPECKQVTCAVKA